jgi:hypothetical protein
MKTWVKICRRLAHRLMPKLNRPELYGDCYPVLGGKFLW